MEATVNMDLSTLATGRQSEIREIEEAENDDMVDRNSWAHSSTSAGCCCCQTNLADN